MLGNGWWNPLPLRIFGRFDLRKYQQTGRPCVKAELHITYTDGSSKDIVILMKPGKLHPDRLFITMFTSVKNMMQDLNKKTGTHTSADKTAWKNAVVVKWAGMEILTAQMQPAIKITKVIKPVKITELQNDTFIVDMGQNFAGVARIKVKGPAGTKIICAMEKIFGKMGH